MRKMAIISIFLKGVLHLILNGTARIRLLIETF